jgi:hypothetical protein
VNVRYVNQGVRGAVTATTPQAFTSAQSVSRNAVRVDDREVASAQVAVSGPSIAPGRQAVLGSGAAARMKPPAILQNRAVVAKTVPPPRPIAFEQQQEAIKANGGRPPAISEIRQAQPPQTAQERPNIKIAPPSKPGTPRNYRINQPGQVQTQSGAANNPNRPSNVQPQPVQGNRPNNPPVNQQNNPPVNNGNPNANQPGNPRQYNDRPGNARPNNANPTPPVNPRVDQKQQQQLEQLRQKQDQERQRVEQQQQRDQQKLQQKQADDARQQQVQQRQQQQLEQLERKHDQEQQKLQQKQQQDRQKEKPAKPPKEKDDKPPKKP